jgi:hypothetical protein
MRRFIQHYKNAKTCIAQIKRGEWVAEWNPISGAYLTAYRGNLELWIGNGSFFCDICDKNYFGILFRHWVWIAGAWKLHYQEAPERKVVPVLTDNDA